MIAETHDETRQAGQKSASYSELYSALSQACSHQEEIKILLELINPDSVQVIYAAKTA